MPEITEQNKIHRYPGVRPFTEEEKHLFYGRDTDTKKLYQLIILEKLVLLYGKSGLGKSSLLNAGVLPLFNDANNYEVIKIRFGTYYAESLSPLETFLAKLPSASPNPVLGKLDAGTDTLWLHIKSLQYNEGQNAKTYILVFDQFEELFSYPPEHVKQFKKQLADLLYAKLPAYISRSITNRLKDNPEFLSNTELEYLQKQPSVKVALSIRSDRMSLLNTLADNLPDILKNYYELKSLDNDAAVDAMEKPAADTSQYYLCDPFKYSVESKQQVLNYLTQNGEKNIETFQLQTICQFVETLAINNKNAEEPKKPFIVEQDMLGDLQNVFRQHYDRLISNIEPLEKRLAARVLIENKLIIDGNRVSLPDIVILKEKGIDKDLLAYLHDIHHLLRSEPNTTGGISYELSHDTLVAPILKAKKEREDQEELIRIDKEKQEELQRIKEKAAQEKAVREKEKRRQRAITGIVSVAAFVALGLAVFGFVMWQKAKQQTQTAQSLTLAALAQEQVDKNPAFSLRLAELAWETYPNESVLLSIQQIALKGFNETMRNKRIFFKNNLRHNGMVSGVAFSPDGKKIVTTSTDSTAKIWNAVSGNLLDDLTGHTGYIYGGTFSNDGEKIITASADSTAKIWDVASGKLITTLRGHTGPVYSAVFSPDGKKIVTASGDKTAKIWDASSGKVIFNLRKDTNAIYSAAFSADGKKVLTTSYNDARIWDVATGAMMFNLKEEQNEVYSAAFSFDGEKVLTTCYDGIRVWDVSSGRKLSDIKDSYSFYAAFSPDGNEIVTASLDSTIKIWDVVSGIMLVQSKKYTDDISMVIFSPDGKNIVTAADDNTAQIWDANSGELINNLAAHTNYITNLAFSPDGKKIATASADHTVKIWDIDTGKILQKNGADIGKLSFTAISPDGKKVFTFSDDEYTDKGYIAKIRDVSTGKLVDSIESYYSVDNAFFSPDSKKIATTFFDDTIKIWDTYSGKLLAKLKAESKLAHFSPDGKKIVTTLNDTIKIWDVASGKWFANLKSDTDIVQMASFSPDNKKVVTALWDGTAKIWDAASGEMLADLKGHTDIVQMAGFSPDNKKVVTTSWDGTAKIWDAASGKLLFDLKGHTDIVNIADFSPDGRKVVTASSDQTAKIWDATSGKMLADLTGFKGEVTNAIFSPNGKEILTTAGKNIKLWDAASGKLLADLAGHSSDVTNAFFSPDGKKIVTSSLDGFKTWLTPEGIIDWLKTASVYKLTQNDLNDLGINFIDLKKVQQ